MLDLNLPKKDGLDVLREIRRKDVNIKILILSARSAVDDRIIGLDEGANDYLVKPFDFGELEARIRNLLRREFSQIPTTVTLGLLSLDTKSKQVSYDGTAVSYTHLKKAYGLNHSNVSRDAWLLTLKMLGRDAEMLEETGRMVLPPEAVERIEKKMNEGLERFKQDSAFEMLEKIQDIDSESQWESLLPAVLEWLEKQKEEYRH